MYYFLPSGRERERETTSLPQAQGRLCERVKINTCRLLCLICCLFVAWNPEIAVTHAIPANGEEPQLQCSETMAAAVIGVGVSQ